MGTSQYFQQIISLLHLVSGYLSSGGTITKLLIVLQNYSFKIDFAIYEIELLLDTNI